MKKDETAEVYFDDFGRMAILSQWGVQLADDSQRIYWLPSSRAVPLAAAILGYYEVKKA